MDILEDKSVNCQSFRHSKWAHLSGVLSSIDIKYEIHTFDKRHELHSVVHLIAGNLIEHQILANN